MNELGKMKEKTYQKIYLCSVFVLIFCRQISAGERNDSWFVLQNPSKSQRKLQF